MALSEMGHLNSNGLPSGKLTYSYIENGHL